MSQSKFGTLLFTLFAILLLMLTPQIASAQADSNATKPAGSFAGKYEGIAKSPTGEVHFTLELTDESGKIGGRSTTTNGVYEVTKGQVIDGALTLELKDKDMVAKLTLRPKDDRLVGELFAHGQTGTVELRRVVKDEVSGDWDAVADAGGQNFPFTLTLKAEGDKLTGGSSSDLGTSTISEGSFKDGKLAFKLNGTAGVVAMIAALQDGKLVGDFDFNGQLQGRWVAVKRK